MAKNQFVLHRHQITVSTLGKLFFLYFNKLKYKADITKFAGDENRPYLVLFNHQTGADQFFVQAAFKKNLYFIATEDIFSLGLLSKALVFLLNPIPIKKNATDLKAVKQCIKVAKEGGSIALAPEGNRTFDGQTVNMRESIVKLAKATKLPIVLFIIDGGYGVQPRWSDCIRKGELKCYTKRVIEYDDYKDLPDEELYQIIKDGLNLDESLDYREYQSNNLAEYLERFIYNCPKCGLSTFESVKNEIFCKKCGLKTTYLPNKHFEEGFAFQTVKEWAKYQEDFILNTDLVDKYGSTLPIYNEVVSLSLVVPAKKKVLLDKEAMLQLFSDRIEITMSDTNEIMKMDFDSCSCFSVLGKNKLNVYHDDLVYQIKGDKRFNPVKYMHFFYKFDKEKKGDFDDKFLGL